MPITAFSKIVGEENLLLFPASGNGDVLVRVIKPLDCKIIQRAMKSKL